jgi:hypothetical protein
MLMGFKLGDRVGIWADLFSKGHIRILGRLANI